MLNLNKMTINKVSVIMGRILKFKNNGLNQKEPCLFENIVIKRVNIIKSFYNEICKLNNLVNKLNDVQNSFIDIPEDLSYHLNLDNDGGMLHSFDNLINSLNKHIVWTEDGNGIPNIQT